MIYVATGTQKFQFDRLLKTLDKLIANGTIKEDVIAQIGHSDYQPQHYAFKDFFSKDEFNNNIEKCNLLITHSGVATIITGLKYNKPVIVVPRLAKFGEHVDDHQVQIAESFSSQNFVMMCGENDDLAELVEQAPGHDFSKYLSQREEILKTIRDYLDTI